MNRVSDGTKPGAYRPDTKFVLAQDTRTGCVYRCQSCGQIHIDLGLVHVKTDEAGFQAVLALLETAAARLELWREAFGG
ncbi:MAG: hypothetical protein NZV14_09320 [Bryobacteraceae bacterium]|nr:hypothetical protein [Bryobacteraceae bacterium]MDW8378351.1 hypothetical protein [Bryobacterales bacterium]